MTVVADVGVTTALSINKTVIEDRSSSVILFGERGILDTSNSFSTIIGKFIYKTFECPNAAQSL